jgi:acyl-CoA synthetase (AMP-forming)/AMP-acid ligase II
MNVADPVRYLAALQPAHPAIRSARRDLSYRELDRRANQVARALLALELRPGDRLGMLVGNRPEHVEVLYGAARAGVVTVTYDPAAPPAELASAFEGLELRAAVVEDSHLAVWRGVQAGLGLPAARTVVVGAGRGDELLYDELVDAAAADEVFGLAGNEDPLTVMRTSGTTGRPKSLLLKHATYIARNLIYGLVFRVTSADVSLGCLPLHFGAGRGLLFGTLAFGGTLLLHDHFDARRALEAIEQERVTFLSMVPTMFLRIVEALEQQRFDTTSLRVMLAFGGLLEESLARRIRTELSPNLYNHYASTDIGSISVLPPDEYVQKPGSVGRPVWPLEVRIAGENGRPLPVGQIGEIMCRGRLVLDAYLEDPEATAELERSGWLPTGDLGALDADGYLSIHGRVKNVVKTGGMSVQADEVEQALLTHPAVREAAVFGVPDPRWGERLCAAVVPRSSAAPVSVEELTSHCRGRLVAYKVPKELHLVEQLPYTSLGKIARQVLREQYSAP